MFCRHCTRFRHPRLNQSATAWLGSASYPERMNLQLASASTQPIRNLVCVGLAWLSTLTISLAASNSPALLNSEFIFESAPFPQCHASTIAETKDGLVAAWFGGTHERHPDVGIWLSRNTNGHWTAPMEVANGVQSATNRFPCWNPVLFQQPNRSLLLFYKVGPSPSTWWGMLTTSSDSGASWSTPRRLPEGILGPIKNKPVQLKDGTLLCPSSKEHDGWRV